MHPRSSIIKHDLQKRKRGGSERERERERETGGRNRERRNTVSVKDYTFHDSLARVEMGKAGGAITRDYQKREGRKESMLVVVVVG